MGKSFSIKTSPFMSFTLDLSSNFSKIETRFSNFFPKEISKARDTTLEAQV